MSLRNLRKLDCYANRYPLRSKTHLAFHASRVPSVLRKRSGLFRRQVTLVRQHRRKPQRAAAAAFFVQGVHHNPRSGFSGSSLFGEARCGRDKRLDFRFPVSLNRHGSRPFLLLEYNTRQQHSPKTLHRLKSRHLLLFFASPRTARASN